jgi:uncharacterized membrane protein YfcA
MDLSLVHIALLFVTAIWAGALNAIAGGGTFFTFPVLLLLGIPPIIANTTNKVGIAIASISGVAGFWPEVKRIRPLLPLFIATALTGSLLGSLLLLITPPQRFEEMVPWLMLGATLLFAFGARFARVISGLRNRAPRPEGEINRPLAAIGQTLIGVYGGFFAAGMGILMMALYATSGMKEIHEMNALKSVAGLAINLISAAVFLAVGIVDWSVAIILIGGALIGGYSGATLSKRLSPAVIRGFIVVYGAAMTVVFFV